jgi:branched-chain amino acid transport system substrate-binding protein
METRLACVERDAAQTAGSNVIFSYTVGPENAVIARDRKTLGWKVPQVGAWTLSFPFFIDGAKDVAEGALMAQTFIAEPSNERRSAFLSAYGRKYNARRISVPMAAAQAYDTVYILMYAMLGMVKNGVVTFAYAEDKAKNLLVQRKK